MLNGFFISSTSKSTSTSRATALALAESNYISVFDPTEDPDHIAGATGTVYYVSNAGSDINNGLTENTPWGTVSKVSNTSFSPGDVIAFNRGDAWADQLTVSSSGISDSSSGRIVYTSYGIGNRPIIKNVSQKTLSWSDQGLNIWRAVASTIVNRLWEDDIELQRAYVHDYTQDIGANYRFMWVEGTISYIYLYHTGTPSSTAYSYGTGRGAYLNSKDYITFSGINIHGGEIGLSNYHSKYMTAQYCDIGMNSSSGFEIRSTSALNVEYSIVEYCNIDSGWAFNENLPDFYSGSNGDTRGCSDGAHLVDKSQNITIRYNTFKKWGHSHIYIYEGGGSPHDMYIHHNQFSGEGVAYGKLLDFLGDAYNIEFAYNYIDGVSGASDLNGHDNHFHHNIMVNTKHSRSRNPSTSVSEGHAIHMNNGAGPVYNNIIEYNIFAHSESEGVRVNGYDSDYPEGTHNITIRNNIFYKNGEYKGTYGYTDTSSIAVYSVPNYVTDIFIYNNLMVHTGDKDPYRFDGTYYATASAFNGSGTDGCIISGNLDGDPLFVDEIGWKIPSTSPAASASDGNAKVGIFTGALLDYEATTMATLYNIGPHDTPKAE